jgi:hypothetical protein
MIGKPLVQGVNVIENLSADTQETGAIAVDTSFLKIGSAKPCKRADFLGRQKGSGVCDFTYVQKVDVRRFICSH